MNINVLGQVGLVCLIFFGCIALAFLVPEVFRKMRNVYTIYFLRGSSLSINRDKVTFIENKLVGDTRTITIHFDGNKENLVLTNLPDISGNRLYEKLIRFMNNK